MTRATVAADQPPVGVGGPRVLWLSPVARIERHNPLRAYRTTQATAQPNNLLSAQSFNRAHGY